MARRFHNVKNRGHQRILRKHSSPERCSSHINEGEIVTLIGANGAGKSTMLKTISGLLKPKQGKIMYEGQSIGGKAAQSIVKMGISHVPEGRRVFANMTVEENLQLGAYLRKDKAGIKQDMEKVYELFPRLLERLKQQSGTFPAGNNKCSRWAEPLWQAAPLVIGRAIDGTCTITSETIFNIIEEINKTGTTILLVEQNANLALSIADRAYVVETGRIVLSGNPRN